MPRRRLQRKDGVGQGGNRRKEALPYWCHRRGVVYDDGLYLPTKSQPLVDGMTGATPRRIALPLCPTAYRTRFCTQEARQRRFLFVTICRSELQARLSALRSMRSAGEPGGHRSRAIAATPSGSCVPTAIHQVTSLTSATLAICNNQGTAVTC